jgi:hypothetical protein
MLIVKGCVSTEKGFPLMIEFVEILFELRVIESSGPGAEGLDKILTVI